MIDHRISLAALATLALVASGCKKDTEEPAAPGGGGHEHHHGTVRLAMTFKINDDPYTLDSVLVDASGHRVVLDDVRFFLSGAHAINDEEQEVGDFRDAYLLFDAATTDNEFELGEMEAGHIHELAFDLGLDSATNHSDPTLYTEPPLNDPDMHWSWNPAMGYKFLVLVGRVDGNNDGDFTDEGIDVEFTVHAAGDDLLTGDHLHAHHTLEEGQTFVAQGVVQMKDILANIDVFPSSGPIMAMGVDAITTQAMANLAIAVDAAE